MMFDKLYPVGSDVEARKKFDRAVGELKKELTQGVPIGDLLGSILVRIERLERNHSKLKD